MQRHGPGGLTALTPGADLEPVGEQLRPRHAAVAATGVLLAQSGGTVEEKVAAALAPADRMTLAGPHSSVQLL